MLNEPFLMPLEQSELSVDLDGSLLQRTVLPNGLRIITESIPGARSATIGFWIGVGSRDEQAENPAAPASLGSTHFLEHLLFKGTRTRTAFEISEAFDRIGADNNALTAKEYTCYHAKVRDRDVPLAVTLLADMVCDSLIEEGAFETERGVILEELAMANDDLGDVAHEAFFETVLPNHPLGRPIGGTPADINAAQRESVWEHYRQHYSPRTLVVCAAGAITHTEFVAHVANAIQAAGGNWADDKDAAPAPRRDRQQKDAITAEPARFVQRESEQVHILLGGPGITSSDERRFEFGVLNSILGGGMSGRLMQEIREKRGLAYTTYSFGGSYSSAGVFGIYAGCAPENTAQVIEIARGELESIAAHGVSEQELQRAQGQLIGAAALAFEDSETRMARLARAELGSGEFWHLDASQAKLEAVTAAQVQQVAADLVKNSNTLVLVGDVASAGY
ncbi:M16 family metallopeptidase [Canibacter zhoujuaniae]|uniref:M16 family metallopeptidase n=1 Tax=Canibacter zhoujuaniae TaxID=2708343 RepID=UPI001FB8A22A|nr:pitrilysin family protein [Canibacter zhoujuaniae]